MRKKAARSIVLALVLGAALAAGYQMLRKRGDNETDPGKKKDAMPPPTYAGVAYGSHPRQVLYFWKAESATPSPLVVVIHAGAWQEGDPLKGIESTVKPMLKAGISVASIGYRLVQDAMVEKVEPPVRAPMEDAARALQFLRSKAGEWNLDKTRVALTGGSAGGCTSLWLAFHPEMADPTSADPIARESTRVSCVAVNHAQTTLDPRQMKEWTPNSEYGSQAFGVFKVVDGKQVTDFHGWLEQREKFLPGIQKYSPIEHVTADDPPIYLSYREAPGLGQAQKDPTHTANFGVKLQEKLKTVGVECELVYPGAHEVKHPKLRDFLISKLKR